MKALQNTTLGGSTFPFKIIFLSTESTTGYIQDGKLIKPHLSFLAKYLIIGSVWKGGVNTGPDIERESAPVVGSIPVPHDKNLLIWQNSTS